MSSNSHSVSTSPPPVEKFPPLSLGPSMHGRVTWAENTYRKYGVAAGARRSAKEYRIFPYGSVLSPVKPLWAQQISRGRVGNDDKTIFRNSMEKRWRVKSRVAVP